MSENNIAVFLDRDGVINKEVDLLHKVGQLELLPRAAEAIKKLNQEGIKVIMVTNQSVIAQGLCTEQDLKEIHQELRNRLNQEGAEIDKIYYCPHHEEADLKQYRKECENRKPNSGFFKKAAEEFDLNLQESFMIGDRTEDIKAGNEAGCVTILVKTGYGGKDEKYEMKPDFIRDNLFKAVNLVLEKV